MSDDLRKSVIPQKDPMGLFAAWYAEARAAEPHDSNAMALATATATGAPSVRMVLLKEFGPGGFTFYTNGQSRKGEEIRANPRAALLFHWKSLRRQIRIEGPLQEVSAASADAYFHSRSRVSQMGSAASDQSRVLADRQTYLDRVAALSEEYGGANGDVYGAGANGGGVIGDGANGANGANSAGASGDGDGAGDGGREIPRPPHWSGFTLAAETIEFWLDRPERLHDRRLFTRVGHSGDAGDWTSELLYP